MCKTRRICVCRELQQAIAEIMLYRFFYSFRRILTVCLRRKKSALYLLFYAAVWFSAAGFSGRPESSAAPVKAEMRKKAAEMDYAAIGSSGLPLPRFVTLKSARVNMRVGPDRNKYPIAWTYCRQGLPVEIVQEYDNWRRIRDKDGTLGWVNAALLSGKRAAIVLGAASAALVPLYAAADKNSAVLIKAESGVIGNIKRCDGQWCLLEINKNRGFIEQDMLWGVYAGEVIK